MSNIKISCFHLLIVLLNMAGLGYAQERVYLPNNPHGDFLISSEEIIFEINPEGKQEKKVDKEDDFWDFEDTIDTNYCHEPFRIIKAESQKRPIRLIISSELPPHYLDSLPYIHNLEHIYFRGTQLLPRFWDQLDKLKALKGLGLEIGGDTLDHFFEQYPNIFTPGHKIDGLRIWNDSIDLSTLNKLINYSSKLWIYSRITDHTNLKHLNKKLEHLAIVSPQDESLDLTFPEKLKSLILFRRTGMSLHKRLQNLTDLEYIFIDEFSLKKFPKGISQMKKLKSLVIMADISSLPKEIKDLPTLEYLRLRNYKLVVPTFIGEIASLKFLELYGTTKDYQRTLNSLSKLSKLEILRLSLTPLKKRISPDTPLKLPDLMGKMDSLKILEIDVSIYGKRDRAKKPELVIPECFSQSPSLTYFSVDHRIDDFQSLKNICAIKSLKKIRMIDEYKYPEAALSTEQVEAYFREFRPDIEVDIYDLDVH